jgi:2-polyprenyl-3-methyl-5-hydroxy-6-metoxy-1,4-benzoquinol methylase
MSVAQWARQMVRSVVRRPSVRVFPGFAEDPELIRVGSRATCYRIRLNGQPHFKKVFVADETACQSFANEMLAQQLFRQYSWLDRWVDFGNDWYISPYYPESCRLDQVASGLDRAGQLDLAGQVLSVLLDLYCERFAHRDIHGLNFFWVDGQLKLVDFEAMTCYPEHARPSFPECYDISGQGLRSPFRTRHTGFAAESNPNCIARLLGVTVAQALEQLSTILKQELHETSLTFQTHHRGRHVCQAQRTYASFHLPQIGIEPDEAQRDCAKRFERFGATAELFTGKRVLDLGSNIGAMLFESQRFFPAECLGVEYDGDKVRVANRVAAFAGLPHVRFLAGNIDEISVQSVGGPYDIVFCLAVDGHVQYPERLYQLLGALTTGVLYFESNASASALSLQQQLSRVGFARVESLGACDDDCRPSNNCRMLFRAWK